MRRLLLKLFRRRRLQRDLEAEIAFHREMAAAHGGSIPFGNTASIEEQALDLWRFTFVENLYRDFVYALRGLRRSPALVVSALLSLGLGIGANTTMFSLGVQMLFSEPSVRDPASLVSVRVGGSSNSKPAAVEFIRQSGLFQDVVGENEESLVNWNDGTETRQIFGVYTTKNYFAALGLPILYGRGILPADPDQVVVLRYRFWRKYYQGDPSIVGHVINLNGKAYTVVGILPAGQRTLFGFGFSPDIYLPRYLDDTTLAIYARLKPGMSISEALAGVETVARRLDAVFPERWKYSDNCEVSPVSGIARMKDQRETRMLGVFFILLLAVTGLVLLIASVNVASLLLARASARRGEIAIRLALGAGRSRLLQQLLVESLVLSLLGAAAGLALAQTVAMLLARVQLPLPLPFRLQVEPDWRVALYAACLAVVAMLACGLLPAWQSVKESIAPDLHRERKSRLRRGLVAAQIAISVVVLTTGFLFLRNLFDASAISPGFDVRHTLRAAVNLPPVTRGDPRRVNRYVGESLRALAAVPGAEAVAAARIIPFTDRLIFGMLVKFSGAPEPVRTRFYWNAVTPEYFRAMDIPIRQGRTFLDSDRGAEHVAIVNRTFVEKYLGRRQALGTTFLWGPDTKTPYRIVGVVADTKNFSIGEDPQAQLYEPLAQTHGNGARLQFVLRSSLPLASQIKPVRQALRRVDPAAGLEAATLYSSIGLAFLPSQVGAVLLGSTGVLGLLLAAIGLYGVVAYSVARRTREIGIRIAVGAARRDIVGMVVLDAARLTGVGAVIGLFVAFFVTRPLAMFLVAGLNPADPANYFVVVAVLILAGFAAIWGPARRAMRIDPLSALRSE